MELKSHQGRNFDSELYRNQCQTLENKRPELQRYIPSLMEWWRE